MKNQWAKAGGLLSYLTIITMLFDFDWLRLIRPKLFFSVLLGMLILTASQHIKGASKGQLAASLKWNLIFSSFLTTLMSLLSFTSSGSTSDAVGRQLTDTLLPMLYGSMLYLVLSLIFKDYGEHMTREQPGMTETAEQKLTAMIVPEQVLRELGLTSRECHVGLKLMEDTSNKEIAAQLYISESTVKKHIQNIYQKVGATDRNSFREICRAATVRK